MPPTITLHITDQSGRILRRIDIPAPMREAYPGGPGMPDTARLDRLLDRICRTIQAETAHAATASARPRVSISATMTAKGDPPDEPWQGSSQLGQQ